MKQYLGQVIVGEYKTTANPILTGYGYIHTLSETPIQIHSYQLISSSRDLYLSDELKQCINKITGCPQSLARRAW